MSLLKFPGDMEPFAGKWNVRDDIQITKAQIRDIYHAPVEPSFVSWCKLWRERSGKLKLSFVEVSGDITMWPPVMNFNSEGVDYYLKTMVSEDDGQSWKDTGWREELDHNWQLNSDSHVRHVFELPDGTLLRNYPHTIEGVTVLSDGMLYYDVTKEGTGDAPYSRGPSFEFYPKFSSIWTSADGGKSWKQIYLFGEQPPFFITALHPLRDGTIVALGAILRDRDKRDVALSQSTDGGKSWSEPEVIVRNDDPINPQGVSEEVDFVELADGRLLVIIRTISGQSCQRQLTLERDSKGLWQASPAVINPFFVNSGCPYMCRASDGTVFYYCHTSMKYSCDEGITWGQVPLGFSYYGQMTEIRPGKILAITQANIGDAPFPWKHDASIRQTDFEYNRIGIAEQKDLDCTYALAGLMVTKTQDFHVALELTVDGANGLAYQHADGDFRFVALTMPDDSSRLSLADKSSEQNTFLVLGKVHGSNTQLLRKIFVGKTLPGAWAEMQVSRQDGIVKAAVKLCQEYDWEATYLCFREEDHRPGKLALFTCKSTGAFRNVRFDNAAAEIRHGWRLFPGKVSMGVQINNLKRD